MNKSIDLIKILKNCPVGTKLYSSIYGEIYFEEIRSNGKYPIITITKSNYTATFTKEGFHYADEDGECILFPSKEQRDWNKFTAPWYKKEKFDPNTLKPFDKVLVRDEQDNLWKADFYSYINVNNIYKYRCIGDIYSYCIPYNDDTKHLVGTTDEAPEFYRYWED